MTKWEAGQDLIACADYLAEKEEDLQKGGFPAEALVLQRARFDIGKIFNRLHAHEFHLPEGSGGGAGGPGVMVAVGGSHGTNEVSVPGQGSNDDVDPR